MRKKSTGRRIGIDVTSAISQEAGIGRYTRELVKALVNESKDDQFTLISAKQTQTGQAENPFLPAKTNVVFKELPINERWIHRIWYRLKVPLSVQYFTGPLDLFHSPDFVLPPINKKTPTLLTVHDLSFIHYPETFTPELVTYLNRIVPWSIDRATHILADSQSTKDDLANQWNIAREKVSVLYSGVGSMFKPITDPRSITRVREKYGLGDKPYLISVGTIQPRKNYRMLIRAFRPVAEKFRNDLVIVGGIGWMHEHIINEVEKQGLGDRVHFLGFVDDADLPALYSAATLFTSPSLYEGFGLPILEAMACGVPVLASDISSMPEVVGDAGVLLPAEDTSAWSEAMLNLIEGMSQRTKMVGAGFLRVRQFTWSKSALELMSIYARLLND